MTRRHADGMDAARNAASEAEKDALGEKLSALGNRLAQDRQNLTAVTKRLQRDASARAGELTAGHDDRSDPESDLGL